MKVKELTLTAILLSIVMVFAPMTMPLGIVPFSLQTFIIPLAVCLLSRKNGLLLVTAYLLLGGFGFPVFAGWSGGWGAIVGPTGGYLIGLLLFPLIIGTKKQAVQPMVTLGIKLLSAGSLQLLVGTVWLANVLSLPMMDAMVIGVFPFVLAFLLKTTLIMLAVKVLSQRSVLNLDTTTIDTM